jgi:hypothetical protein
MKLKNGFFFSSLLVQTVIFCALVFCGVSAVFAAGEPNSPDLLIIHVTGSTIEENLDDMLEATFIDNFRISPPVTVALYPGSDINKSESEKYSSADSEMLKANVYPKAKNVIITIIPSYNGDAHQWIQKRNYPQAALSLMDDAAASVSRIVKDFKGWYPNAKVVGVAICVGCEVLIKSMEKGEAVFDRLILVSPPVTDESAFNQLLLDNGYDSKNALVVQPADDKTCPVRLKGNGGGFTLINKPKS